MKTDYGSWKVARGQMRGGRRLSWVNLVLGGVLVFLSLMVGGLFSNAETLNHSRFFKAEEQGALRFCRLDVTQVTEAKEGTNKVFNEQFWATTAQLQSQKQGQVLVRHLDREGQQLLPDCLLTGKLSTAYQIKGEEFRNFCLVATEGSPTGQFSARRQTLTCIYEEQQPPRKHANQGILGGQQQQRRQHDNQTKPGQVNPSPQIPAKPAEGSQSADPAVGSQTRRQQRIHPQSPHHSPTRQHYGRR
ncbi:MucBP domain-containing protein [Enterococcus diestrammenae]|uniref:MucBP domain-containing protein n=1 Tax=Enterococcus diestrammenae TaxID=1155073 RepID=A0ABV0F4I5_9ENTE|nr:MucBP domain-containing protein [Enterococcus diestrammenae]KAF1296934.1 hypothetical protein BAU18_14540 [Enterococcus diestrammenae]